MIGMNHLIGDALLQQAFRLHGDTEENVLVVLKLHNQFET